MSYLLLLLSFVLVALALAVVSEPRSTADRHCRALGHNASVITDSGRIECIKVTREVVE